MKRFTKKEIEDICILVAHAGLDLEFEYMPSTLSEKETKLLQRFANLIGNRLKNIPVFYPKR